MKSMSLIMTATDIDTLLRERHADDLYIPECKDGETQTRHHFRLDAWVLRRTWSPVTTIGYEIKVDRSDWLRDTKWQQYVGLCHEFAVVAPKGVVQLQELPQDVGLVEVLGGRRLVTRRKAVHRKIEVPAALLLYVLMARVAAKYGEPDKGARMAEWRRWLELKNESRELGRRVAERIRKAWADLRDQTASAKRSADDYVTIRARLAELGFDPDKPVSTWQVENRVAMMTMKVPEALKYDLKCAIKSLHSLARTLNVEE